MKKFIFRLLVLFFLLLPVFSNPYKPRIIELNSSYRNAYLYSASNIYHVSKNGFDYNSGSEYSPFFSIQKALDSASPGTVILVHEGTYFEKLVINVSGSEYGGYITLIPYENDTAIINGSYSPDPDNTFGDNIIYNVHSSGGGGYTAGIYVDGASDIIIEQNIVYNSDLGIEVGAENKGVIVSGIIVRNNLVYFNDKAGIVFGGYAEDRGRVINSIFTNNTCYKNNQVKSKGEIWIQYSENNLVTNNILYTTEYENGRAIILSSFEDNTYLLNTIDNNIYYAEPEINSDYFFRLHGISFDNLKDFQDATGQDSNSFFINPNLGSSNDFYGFFNLNDNSKAINNGFIHQYIGDIDASGNIRVYDNNIDIGAIEREFKSVSEKTNTFKF